MYELHSRVRYSEADQKGRLSVSGIMNYLQDCCTMQAEDLGIGLSYLAEHHIGWFVTSYQIKICKELPKVGEAIIVKTWPYRFRGMLGYRNFTIEDESGNIYIEADSLWILMDLDKLAPVRLSKEMLEAYTIDPQLQGTWNLRKRTLPDEREVSYDFMVSRLHLDTNHHMNNAHYVEAARACLPEGDTLSEIYVEFRKSAVLEDHVICRCVQNENRKLITLENDEQEIYAVVEFTINN